MNDKIKAIVLRKTDYKENDVLLYVLSKDKGILTFIAKGAKKITSKHHFFESCLYEFIIDYVDYKTMYMIHGSKLITSYYEMSDIELMSYKNILLDLTYKSKEVQEISMYDNLKMLLDNINQNNKYLLGSLYISYLSRVYGVMANVDECVICKNKKVVGISNYHGGFICLEHLNGEDAKDIDTLKKFRLITKAKFENYELIKDVKYSFNDFKLVLEFFMHNTGLNLKTFDFYKSLI